MTTRSSSPQSTSRPTMSSNGPSLMRTRSPGLRRCAGASSSNAPSRFALAQHVDDLGRAPAIGSSPPRTMPATPTVDSIGRHAHRRAVDADEQIAREQRPQHDVAPARMAHPAAIARQIGRHSPAAADSRPPSPRLRAGYGRHTSASWRGLRGRRATDAQHLGRDDALGGDTVRSAAAASSASKLACGVRVSVTTTPSIAPASATRSVEIGDHGTAAAASLRRPRRRRRRRSRPPPRWRSAP